jgi:aminopeptidase N
VRDFAFASSKLFVWDAAGYRYSPAGRVIELSSYYPREGMPLWDKVSTRAIKQTLVTYGRMALEYPYPRATNVHGPVGGMEYPMVAFCGVRPNDGKYTQQMENALVSVSIHEVGHNWFPMIVASDERKWTWMDEGLNSFVQHYAELDWRADFPPMFGTPKAIVPYMSNFNQAPIMTHSDQIHRGFSPNGYDKPAAGLVILRETILGPERFDVAFRDYAQRWAFRKPQPEDFFRSMEDGAGENLAWYWRGWFYTTHANDQAVVDVTTQSADSLLGTTERGAHYNRVRLRNEGGLVMPVLMRITLEDGTVQDIKLPVEIWRNNENEFTYGFFSASPVLKVQLDPEERMADIRTANNLWQRTRPVT